MDNFYLFFSFSLRETSPHKSVALTLSAPKIDMSDPLIFKLLFTQIPKPQSRFICHQLKIHYENVPLTLTGKCLN